MGVKHVCSDLGSPEVSFFYYLYEIISNVNNFRAVDI